MELTDMTKELHDSTQRLKQAESELYKLAREKAEAEREYRQALHRAIMEYKDNGERATLIPDLARGKASEEKFERDLADARYTAGRESLDAIKTQVSAVQTILKFHEEV